MIKCAINMRTGDEEICVSGKLATIFTELEELIRGIREHIEAEGIPEEVRNKLLDTAFENAKLSRKESALRTVERAGLSDFAKDLVKKLIEKDEE